MKKAGILLVFAAMLALSFVSAQECNEDDNGIDFLNYGVVSDPVVILANDYCINPNVTREYYCNLTRDLVDYVDAVCAKGCANDTCVEGNVSCIIKKCSQLGYECGTQSMGCAGITENCGSCASGKVCQSGKCVSGGGGGGDDNGNGGGGGGGFATSGNCSYTTSVGECVDGLKTVSYIYSMKFSGKNYTRAQWSSLTGPGRGNITGFRCPVDTSEEVPCQTVGDELVDITPESSSNFGKYLLIIVIIAIAIGAVVGAFFLYRFIRKPGQEGNPAPGSSGVQIS